MSRNLLFTILATLPLGGGWICATAQTAPATPAHSAHPSFFQHMLQEMDTNGDGKISQAEYLTAAKARFHSIDTQNKGSITAADLAASRQTMQRDQMIAQHIVAHLDTAGNGYITRDEALAAAKARFAKLDTTGTGKLTPSQFEAARGHRKGASAAQSVPRAQFAQKMMQHHFDKLDANHDGGVTLDEYLAAAGARFDKLDTNHTGKLTPQEIAASPRMLRHDEFASHRELRHLGAGANGSVTEDQYLAAAKGRFATLDSNGDGYIEADELPTHHWKHAPSQSPPSD
ncbi:MAG: EF-hand domain-containing protein [Rudaea sp.]